MKLHVSRSPETRFAVLSPVNAGKAFSGDLGRQIFKACQLRLVMLLLCTARSLLVAHWLRCDLACLQSGLSEAKHSVSQPVPKVCFVSPCVSCLARAHVLAINLPQFLSMGVSCLHCLPVDIGIPAVICKQLTSSFTSIHACFRLAVQTFVGEDFQPGSILCVANAAT